MTVDHQYAEEACARLQAAMPNDRVFVVDRAHDLDAFVQGAKSKLMLRVIRADGEFGAFVDVHLLNPDTGDAGVAAVAEMVGYGLSRLIEEEREKSRLITWTLTNTIGEGDEG